MARLVKLSLVASCACSTAPSAAITTDATPDGSFVADGALVADAPVAGLKKHYGHYFATNYTDTPASAAALCEEPGVTGIVWRQPWNAVEPTAGHYDFSSFDQVLAAISHSANPSCQLWLFIEFKSFSNSPTHNPCPAYLQAQHSAPNVDDPAATCFMWEPVVNNAYIAMMQAAGQHFDQNPRVEGLILEESSLSLNGAYSQDVAVGGTYTAVAWRDGLIKLIQGCSAAFPHSRCTAFLNFLRGGNAYLADVSAAISAIPDNQACFSGPDLLPDNTSLTTGSSSAYQLLTRHTGCRSNSAQNDSFDVPGFGLESIFQFAVGGTFGSFDASAPRTSGVCVNSYLFWNHLVARSPRTNLNWTDALPVIAAHPYGPDWYGQCAGGGGAP